MKVLYLACQPRITSASSSAFSDKILSIVQTERLKDHQEKKILVQADYSSNKLIQERKLNDDKTYSGAEIEGPDKSISNIIKNKTETLNSVLNNNNIQIQNDECIAEVETLRNPKQTFDIIFGNEEEKLVQKENTKQSITKDKVNILEQLEFTQCVLISKDEELKSLNNKIKFLEEENNSFKIRIQQLTDGHDNLSVDLGIETNVSISKKNSALDEQLKLLQKERDQLRMHYEHYVAEINEQLKSTMTTNDQLTNEIQNLMQRESSLIEQISQLEIRLQNIQSKEAVFVNKENAGVLEFKQRYMDIEFKMKQLQREYEDTLNKLTKTEAEMQYHKEIKQGQEIDSESVLKLSADITSDKVAAQRATEQNIKLKHDLEHLERAFVKMSQDKLDLIEKLSAEKFLNRELTIKLSEIEKKLDTTHLALRSKDNEMIRLLKSYSDLQKKLQFVYPIEDAASEVQDQPYNADNNELLECSETEAHQKCKNNYNALGKPEQICHNSGTSSTVDCSLIPREDAMLKLQDRFFKIMKEVANLSDEKHQLEHIVTQLQNETDTICEYVALYQQQRSLLKKRDQERTAQIKAFQTECSSLREQLNQLSEIIVKLTEDEHLGSYFKSDARRNEISKTLELVTKLRDNVIINSDSNCAQLNNFYPCACCSGKLIDV